MGDFEMVWEGVNILFFLATSLFKENITTLLKNY